MKPVEVYRLKSDEKIELFEIDCVEPKKTILIIGVFHGEEPQGEFVIKKFLNENIPLRIKNKTYFIPCLNPDGMKRNQRVNSNGVDLNRNFPTKNWVLKDKNSDDFGGFSPKSEEETAFLIETIDKIKPDFILALHSPFAIVNYDGDAQKEADIISKFTDYPIQKDIGYPTPGSFGTYYGVERNVPTITLEYSDKEDLTSIYKKSEKIFNYLISEYE